MKTSQFEGGVASWAAGAAQGRDESTQREPATFDFNFGRARLVGAADCSRAGCQSRDGREVFTAGPIKTGHCDRRRRS